MSRHDVRPAAEAVAHAVRTRSLPSLAAFYGQDLTLLACTDTYAASCGGTQEELCGRSVTEVVRAADGEQLMPHLIRSVLGATVHLTVRGLDEVGRQRLEHLTLVPYVVDGEQLGVAVLTDEATAP